MKQPSPLGTNSSSLVGPPVSLPLTRIAENIFSSEKVPELAKRIRNFTGIFNLRKYLFLSYLKFTINKWKLSVWQGSENKVGSIVNNLQNAEYFRIIFQTI